MIIHQMLPNFSYGDAIGDDTLALRDIFRSLGHESRIYAGVIHPYLIDQSEHWKLYRRISQADHILIYHFSVGSEITDYLMTIPDRLGIIFHNITPAHWFYGISPQMTELAAQGMIQLRKLKDRTAFAWADSTFNAGILNDIGYRNVEVLPIIVDLSRLSLTPNRVFQTQFASRQRTWLFVGRVSPNKCHQDIIRSFAFYQRHLDPNARLILVGDVRNCWRYADAMSAMVRELGVANVIFTGMVDDDELVALYRMADVFVCMSEHEGFCVPLLEAMVFDVPVIAYKAGAVSETMGDAGIQIHDKNPAVIAEIADLLRRNPSFKEAVVRKQQNHLSAFLAMDMRQRVNELIGKLGT